MRKPPSSTNGTAISVSFTALGASTVDRANVNASHAGDRRGTPTVSAMIHGGERSRSRSSPVRRRARRGERAHEPADDRLRELGERVDRGDRDRAGADEPHLRAPDRRRCAPRASTPAAAGCIDVRIGTAMAHAMMQADQHRHADRQPDEMAGAEQRERPRDVVAARRRSRRVGRSR